MTYDELLTTDKKILTAEEAAEVIGCTAQLIRIKARDPEKRKTLGFPIMCIGNRVKIPAAGLKRFLEGTSFDLNTTSERIAKQFYDELNRSGADKEQVVVKLSELVYDAR